MLLTLNKPKCLLKFRGHSILEYQLGLLADAGIEDISIITGYRETHIRTAVGMRARCVYYPDFSTTNNLHTLRYCRHLLDCPTVIMFADVLVGRSGFSRLFDSNRDFVLLVDTDNNLPGTMRVQLKDSTLARIGQDVPVEGGDGNFIGILKTSGHGAKMLADELEIMFDENAYENDYYTKALPRLSGNGATYGIQSVADVPWYEIDTVSDYITLKRNFASLDLEHP
jgi:phosphoenolpyruvate phosphomutase